MTAMTDPFLNRSNDYIEGGSFVSVEVLVLLTAKNTTVDCAVLAIKNAGTPDRKGNAKCEQSLTFVHIESINKWKFYASYFLLL